MRILRPSIWTGSPDLILFKNFVCLCLPLILSEPFAPSLKDSYNLILMLAWLPIDMAFVPLSECASSVSIFGLRDDARTFLPPGYGDLGGFGQWRVESSV